MTIYKTHVIQQTDNPKSTSGPTLTKIAAGTSPDHSRCMLSGKYCMQVVKKQQQKANLETLLEITLKFLNHLSPLKAKAKSNYT